MNIVWPATDPNTLLMAIVLVFFFAAVVWWLFATGMRVTPKASLCLAASNLLLAGSLGLHALRGVAPDLLAFWVSDLLGQLAFALLCLAVPLIADERPRLLLPGLLAGAASLTLLLMPYEGDLSRHAMVVYASLSALCLLAGSDAYRLLRQRVKPGLAGLLAAPLFVVTLLLLARLLETWMAPGVTPDIRVASGFNIAWLWSTLALNLVLNATMAFYVLMRLILRIQRLTQRDPLTDALNRRALAQAMEREHARLQRGTPYALVMVDMDRFKQLNDSHGHAAGDAALQALVQALRPCVRAVDQLGRLGGEEFCALLPDTGLAGALLVAERMRVNLEACGFSWDGKTCPLTASFGVAEASLADASAEQVLMRADRALYQAKAQGRNVVQASGA